MRTAALTGSDSAALHRELRKGLVQARDRAQPAFRRTYRQRPVRKHDQADAIIIWGHDLAQSAPQCWRTDRADPGAPARTRLKRPASIAIRMSKC